MSTALWHEVLVTVALLRILKGARLFSSLVMRLSYLLVVFLSLGIDALNSTADETDATGGCLKSTHGTFLSYQGFLQKLSASPNCKILANCFSEIDKVRILHFQTTLCDKF